MQNLQAQIGEQDSALATKAVRQRDALEALKTPVKFRRAFPPPLGPRVGYVTDYNYRYIVGTPTPETGKTAKAVKRYGLSRPLSNLILTLQLRAPQRCSFSNGIIGQTSPDA
jgi:hypothetical protein